MTAFDTTMDFPGLLVQRCLDKHDDIYVCDETCIAKRRPQKKRQESHPSCPCFAKSSSALFRLYTQAKEEFKRVAERFMVETQLDEDLDFDSDARCEDLRKIIKAIDAILKFSASIHIATPTSPPLRSEEEQPGFKFDFKYIRQGLALPFVAREWFEDGADDKAMMSDGSHGEDEEEEEEEGTSVDGADQLREEHLRSMILDFHRKFQIIGLSDSRSCDLPVSRDSGNRPPRISDDLRNGLYLSMAQGLLALYPGFDLVWKATADFTFRERAILVYAVSTRTPSWCEFVYQEIFLTETDDSYANSVILRLVSSASSNHQLFVQTMASRFHEDFLVCFDNGQCAPGQTDTGRLSQFLFKCGTKYPSRLQCTFMFLLDAITTNETLVDALNRELFELRYWLYKSVSAIEPKTIGNRNREVELLGYLDRRVQFGPYAPGEGEDDGVSFRGENLEYRDRSRGFIAFYDICLALYRRRSARTAAGFLLPRELMIRFKTFLA